MQSFGCIGNKLKKA